MVVQWCYKGVTVVLHLFSFPAGQESERVTVMVFETAGSRQQTADSRKQITDSRQQTADSRQQTADSRRQTADSRQRYRCSLSRMLLGFWSA
jgi:hypothetical protein